MKFTRFRRPVNNVQCDAYELMSVQRNTVQSKYGVSFFGVEKWFTNKPLVLKSWPGMQKRSQSQTLQGLSRKQVIGTTTLPDL